MSNVKRIYVEKKAAYAVKAKELLEEVKNYLQFDITNVRVLVRYDIENISEDTYQKSLRTVFSEAPVDTLYEETFPVSEGEQVFSVEYLPGQFDQRADSAEQCVKLLNEEEEPIIRSATTYVIAGDINAEQLEQIKGFCINPVDSRETDETKPETLTTEFEDPADVIIFDGFANMEEAKLKELYDSLGLAMTFKDFLHIQNYFKNEENRDPSMTEIRVLDTYWSDHCRHTTFLTELTDITFDEGYYQEPIKKAYVPKQGEILDRYGPDNGRFTCPVIDGKPFRYEQRSLPYIEDAASYHRYRVTGDFSNIEQYVNDCESSLLKQKIDAYVTRWYDGDYSQLLIYSGEIAGIDGWGVGGGIQYELPMPVDWFVELGLLEEIIM